MGRKNKKKSDNLQKETTNELLPPPISVTIALYLLSFLQTIGKIILFPLKYSWKIISLFVSKKFYFRLQKKIIIWGRILVYYLRLIIRIVKTQLTFIRITLGWKLHCIVQMFSTFNERKLPKEHTIFAAKTTPSSRLKNMFRLFFP